MFTIVMSIVIALAVFGALYFINMDVQDLSSTDRYAKKTIYPARKFAALAFLFPVIVFIFESFTVVPAGHVGVQVTLGEVNPTPLSEGVHFVNPFSSVKNVEVRVVKAELKGSSAGTKDLQVVHTDIVVNYRIAGQQAAHMYKEFGLDLENKILLPSANEAFKAVTAHYTSEELVTKRGEVSKTIHETLQEKVAKYGLTVSEISLVNFGFSGEYQKAIEQKVIATQQKQKAEQDLERIKVEAASRIAQAEGEAKAIAIQAQAIQSNGGQQYVQLQWIEKWDGKMPNTVVNGSQGMMLNVGK
jgi:regulator of protease activity HflC (stomatin/prohibitin superfamily)